MNTYQIIDSDEVQSHLGINDVPEEIYVVDMAHRSVHVKYSTDEYVHSWSYDTFNKLVSGGAITLN